jgi:hypothetical protein
MKPYKPSGKVPVFSYPSMSLASLGGGYIVGNITHFISQLFYLVFIFPIGMGFLGGLCIFLAINSSKVRNPVIAAVFGIITGLSIYSTTNYLDYQSFKNGTISEIKKDPDLKNSNPELAVNKILQSEVGSDGFIGFIKYEAKQGVSIGRIGRSESNLGETGTWIYWFIELAIVTSITTGLAISSASQPFSEESDDWYDEEVRIGNVNSSLVARFLILIENDSFREAGQLIDNTELIDQSNDLIIKRQIVSDNPNADIFITIEKATIDKDGKLDTEKLSSGMISVADYGRLNHGLDSQQSGS